MRLIDAARFHAYAVARLKNIIAIIANLSIIAGCGTGSSLNSFALLMLNGSSALTEGAGPPNKVDAAGRNWDLAEDT